MNVFRKNRQVIIAIFNLLALFSKKCLTGIYLERGLLMSEKTKQLLQRIRSDLREITPSKIREFDQEVSSIPGIIKLTLGEPDFNTPEHIKEAGILSIKNNHTHYPTSIGTFGLRQAAANFLDRKYNLKYDYENVIVTVGATEAISAAIGSIINPGKGEKIILPTPIWPMYIPITKMHGAEPIFINTSKDNYILRPQRLKAALDKYGDQVKGVILNFPANPTGITYSRKDVQAIVTVLQGYNVFVISDEIYSELTYGKKHVSVAEYLPDQTILINGVSKSHAMTGWRIGIICAPKVIVKEIFKLHQFSVTTATYAAQDAAQEAFENGFNDSQAMKAQYQQRGSFVYQELKAIGFEVLKPQGAFYIFFKLPTWLNEDEFCHELAYDYQVAVAGCTPFGPGGEGHIRISYASSMKNLKAAMKRMKEYVAEKKNRSVLLIPSQLR